jgi:hypothetical protein
MLEQDSKNYHVWSYRQWLVKRFDLFDKPEELEWTAEMIEDDVRNNSAWNHRYYLVVGGRDGKPSEEIAKREVEYVILLLECGVARLIARQIHQNSYPQGTAESEPMELPVRHSPRCAITKVHCQGLYARIRRFGPAE